MAITIPPVTIRVLYFASFRDARKRDEEERNVPSGSTVGAVWEILAAEVPEFRSYLRMPAAAVNGEYAQEGEQLRDGDEIAFLPPVSGGSR